MSTLLSLPVMSMDEAIVATAAAAEEYSAGPLIDGCGRVIDHLRLSVTSACDLRCAYCRPKGEVGIAPTGRVLCDRQRLDLLRFLYEVHGLRQLRITGGEPLLHRTLLTLLEAVRESAPDLGLAMTTNGQRLAGLATNLRGVGLERLNISLDTLDPDRYRRLTGGELRPVLAGLDAAVAAGFSTVKINAVVLRGINDGQLADLARWAIDGGFEIRFLEAMPIGPASAFNREHFVPVSQIRRRLEEAFRLTPLPRRRGETAVRYEASDGERLGVVGIIAPLSESFCGQCRRIRVTADGMLYPCLLDSRKVDLRRAWRGGELSPHHAGILIRRAIEGKQPGGRLRQPTAMITLGG